MHVGARPCTEGDGRPAGAVGFHRVWADSNQRGGARARRKRACCASSRERASARGGAVRLAHARKSAARVEHAAGTPEHGRAPRESGRPAGAVGFHRVWADSNQRGGARARRKRACCASSRERASARGGAVRTCARTQVSCSCGARGWHVGARPCTEGDGRPAGAVGFHRVWTDSNQRGGARARRKRACCASSRERASARGGAVRLAHARKSAARVEHAAGTSEHGRAPRESGRPAGAVGFHRVWADSNQRGGARARRKRACCASSRERASARGGAVLTCARTQVSCSCGARGWHVGARPCTEGDGRPAGAVGFHRVWADSNQRGGARARRKRACCASSRERASARGGAVLTCARSQVSCSCGGRGWHVGARPCTEGERPSRWRSGLP